MNNNTKPWTEYQELKDIVSAMDDIVARANQTREILRQQNNENYVDDQPPITNPLREFMEISDWIIASRARRRERLRREGLDKNE
jgi:hypothetical protein